ncbi:MAG: hypothetical protein ISS49_02180 [Anaerolineae bacterium]|nr:hypothetical protein [Anaerolineae bacterium]
MNKNVQFTCRSSGLLALDKLVCSWYTSPIAADFAALFRRQTIRAWLK